MEFTLSVNDLLPDNITKLNYTLIPPGIKGNTNWNMRVIQDTLSRLINHLGAQSAAAQGLKNIITTAEKLRNSPTHILYLLKDAEAKGGAGELIGLLKVGRKHLYLYYKDKVCEVDPLCVLDFYVAQDRQRRGLGRALFSHMLAELGAQPWQLAVDGPSPKMEQFLAKNYGIDQLLRQNNNFAVAPNFFDSLRDVSKAEPAPPPPAAVGRFSAHKPPSSIANVIHGDAAGCADADSRYSSQRVHWH